MVLLRFCVWIDVNKGYPLLTRRPAGAEEPVPCVSTYRTERRVSPESVRKGRRRKNFFSVRPKKRK